MGWGSGCECERRIEVIVKFQKKIGRVGLGCQGRCERRSEVFVTILGDVNQE